MNVTREELGCIGCFIDEIIRRAPGFTYPVHPDGFAVDVPDEETRSSFMEAVRETERHCFGLSSVDECPVTFYIQVRMLDSYSSDSRRVIMLPSDEYRIPLHTVAPWAYT